MKNSKMALIFIISLFLIADAQLTSQNKFLEVSNKIEITKQKDKFYFQHVCLMDQKCKDCSYGFMCPFSQTREKQEKCYKDCLDYEHTYYYEPEEEMKDGQNSPNAVEQIELKSNEEICTNSKLCSKCSYQNCGKIQNQEKQEKCFSMCFNYRKNFQRHAKKL